MTKPDMSVATSAGTQARKPLAPAPRKVVSLMPWMWGPRQAVAMGLVTTILHLCTTVAFAFPKPDSKVLTGMITIGGVVTIDGLPARSGQTLFSGSSIAAAARSESTVYLANLTRFKLYSESNLTLEFNGSSLSASLENGGLQGFVPIGIRADILTADASIASHPDQPAAFSIQVEAGNTTISVETGRVEVRAGNRLKSVSAGERFSTTNDGQPLPEPQQNVNKRKLVWLFLGIGAAVAVLVVAITGRDNQPTCDTVVIVSPSTGGPGVCQ
jgi:hypothetical protein